MSSGTAGAAGFTSSAGLSGVVLPQPAARKQAVKTPSAAVRQMLRAAARFLEMALPVPEGKDGSEAGTLADIFEQSHSVEFSIADGSKLLCPSNEHGEGAMPQF